MKSPNVKLIYNPNAGNKRNLGNNSSSLEEITGLLNKYQIAVDLAPTRKPGDAEDIAKKSVKDGYKTILVAGGDGTVGETANGLIGTETILGILPIGSFMNIAKMLSIPFDLEKAVELIKIGRVRKIDAGLVQSTAGGKLKHYFLESAGIGMEANFHKYFKLLEKGRFSALGDLFKLLFHYHRFDAKIYIDNRQMEVKTHLITVNNGPLSGASLNTAPQSKLNDHKLTVSIYKMSKFQIFDFLTGAFSKKVIFHPQIESFQGQNLKIETTKGIKIHADGRFFAKTPVEFSILPNALSVISGFPDDAQSSLLKRTPLDP